MKKFSESIKNEGLMAALQRAVRTVIIKISLLRDYQFDWKYGTDTRSWVKLDDLDIHSENKEKGVEYQATRESTFKVLMNKIVLPQEGDNVFVDFGSGKGRTLLMASSYPYFKRIVGIEFSDELCKIAEENVPIYRMKTGVEIPFEIIASDVLKYDFKDDENFLYMANPFDNDVMQKLLQNIEASLERRPRKVILVYTNPVHSGVVDQCAFLKKTQDFYLPSSCQTVFVYTNF